MRLYVEKAFGKELTAINGVTAKSCKSFRKKKNEWSHIPLNEALRHMTVAT